MWGALTISSDNYGVELLAITEDFKTYQHPCLTWNIEKPLSWDADHYLATELYPYLKKIVNKESIVYDKEIHQLLEETMTTVEELYNMFNKAIELGFFKNYEL